MRITALHVARSFPYSEYIWNYINLFVDFLDVFLERISRGPVEDWVACNTKRTFRNEFLG